MFRKFLKFVLLLSTTSAALAQGTPRTLLWKVTGNGVEEPSYLFGTVHSMDKRAFGLGDSVFHAMGRVAVVAGELDMENATQQAFGMMQTMMLPDEKQLKDFYKKKEWAFVEAELKEALGPMAPLTYRMKPFMVLAMLTATSMAQDKEKVLDDHLLSTAKAQGQRVIGLETMQEQLAALDALPLKEQAAMLLDHVRNDGYEGELNAMMDAYEAQDLDEIMRITEKSGSMTKPLEKALLTDRNERMVHRLDSIMQGREDIFFAVGAAHLPGEQGLIELLRRRGYSVDPVIYEATRREEIEPVIEEKQD